MKLALFFLALAGAPALAAAQQHGAAPAPNAATLPGQDAYGAIAEVVRLLEADATTNWSTVDLEALRQHLIDMNAVTLQSRVVQHAVPGGIDMVITGDTRTETALRSMVQAHGRELAPLGLSARSEPVAGGVHFVVTATNAADSKLVAKVQGLGFIGLMTLGAHHPVHHMALARGMAMAGH